ncbi:hypothetical protein BDP27DRAFT_1300736 [Rhodocollybia butyracea]|uniref:AAA+ ATPase domain-containing protein n=1 Tax=Rhodocollybia butyracea TaxID=206335 RepID=A0A9P5PDI0_9AGAR|nr:hypothetical protein BDP27DRAFT_1300736 [Rhodocollybia butyracea]
MANALSSSMGSLCITLVRLHSAKLGPDSRKYFAKVTIDGKGHTTTSTTLSVGWDGNRMAFSDVRGSSKLRIEVFRHRKLHSDMLVGSYEEEVENFLMKTFNGSSVVQPLRSTSNDLVDRIELKVDVEASRNSVAMAAAVQRAKIQASRLQRSSSSVTTSISPIQTPDNVYSGTTEDALGNFIPLLEKLQVFSNLANSVAEIHPYADAAYSIVSLAYKTVLAQMQRDKNILALIDTMDDIYSFVKEAEPLRQIESHKRVMICIAQQTTECGYFVSAYCSDNFVFRILKHSVATTDAAIVHYGNKFSELKAALLDHATITTGITVLRILETVERIETKIDLSDLPYANGARFHGSKQCLPGTRESVLGKIISWIDAPSTPDGKHLFLLTGAPGSGKSAIAHSLAGHYSELHRLGSSIFADLPDEAVTRSRLPILLFPTIARDLADLDPQYRHTLWSMIESDRALRKTVDPIDQFEKFIITPSNSLAFSGPIVIIIDGLDECPSSQALNQFLSVLAQRVTNLASNFRIILTARTSSRLLQYFSETMAQIYQIDNMGWSAKYDLSQLSKSRFRSGLTREQFEQFDHSMVDKLVEQSQGSFQWMMKACDTICGIDPEANLQLTPFERYQALVPISPNTQPPVQPDDNLYMQELTTIYTEQGPLFTAQFKSVMGILLAARTSLSLRELKQLSNHPEGGNIDIMLGALDALLQNTTYLYASIIPFHSSFYDFLQNPAHSGQFFVNVSDHHIGLAKSCLQVLNDQLCFNICHLASSYLPNTEINDLSDHMEKYITPELSYASQYWIHHVVMVPSVAVEVLVPQVERLLQTQFFFWLEVLSVFGCVRIAVKGLQDLLLWGSEVQNLARAALSFVKTFEPAITSSAPHIYVSGLHFWPLPNQEQFQPRFTFPLVSRSQDAQQFFNLPAHALPSRECITGLAFSPDCKYLLFQNFATFDYSLWDIPANAPHKIAEDQCPYPDEWDNTRGAFSSDGKAITVLAEKQMETYDVQTGHLLHEMGDINVLDEHVKRGSLQADGRRLAFTNRYFNSVFIRNVNSGRVELELRGKGKWHVDYVKCMEFSPLGNFLACSTDNKICIWNAHTGEEVFAFQPDFTPNPSLKPCFGKLVFSPDESILFCGYTTLASDGLSAQHSVYILRWNTQNEQPVQTVELSIQSLDGQSSLILKPDIGNYFNFYRRDGQIAVSPTMRYLVYSGGDGLNGPALHIIDLKTNLVATTLASSSHVTSLAISSDETMIAAGHEDGSVHVWRVSMPFGGCHELWGKGDDDSGWIYGSNKELLAWVPPELREGLNWNPRFSGDAHGMSWVNCLVEESQEIS